MFNFPYTDLSSRVAVLIVPYVLLLCWLFNTYRMRRISRRNYVRYLICIIILMIVTWKGAYLLGL